MTTLRKAYDEGQIEQFVKEHADDPKGDTTPSIVLCGQWLESRSQRRTHRSRIVPTIEPELIFLGIANKVSY